MDRAEEGDDDGAVAELDGLEVGEELVRGPVGDHDAVEQLVVRRPRRVEVPGEVDGGEGGEDVGDCAG